MNIFVAKLNFDTQSEDVQRAFEAFGAVDSAKVIMDRETGRSRGFAFVEMANDDEARAAIAQLHDTEVLGRNIVVNESTPRPEGERSFTKKPYGAGGGGNRGGGGGFNRGGTGGGYNRDRGGNGGGEYNRY